MITTIVSAISFSLGIFFYFVSSKKCKENTNSIKYKKLEIVQNAILAAMFTCSGIILFLNQNLAMIIASLHILAFIILAFIRIFSSVNEIKFIELKEKLGLK